MTRGVRAWAACLFALLLIPGLVGFDLWPLTGWRLYSVSTTATRIEWGVEAVTPAGPRDFTWPEFPLAYRLAAWPLAKLPGSSAERKEAVCRALLKGARESDPEVTAIALVRDRRTMSDDGEVTTERERVQRCGDR